MVLTGGREYWTDLMGWMRKHLLEPGRLSAEDLAQAEIADGAEGVIEALDLRFSGTA